MQTNYRPSNASNIVIRFKKLSTQTKSRRHMQALPFFPQGYHWLSTQSKCGSQDALCQSSWQSQREFWPEWTMKDCTWQWHSQLWEAKRKNGKTARTWMHTCVAMPTRGLHAWTHSWQSQRESQKTNFTLQTRMAMPMLRKCTRISVCTASS